jgi:hypothetical protein
MLEEEIETKPYLREQMRKGNQNNPYRMTCIRRKGKRKENGTWV